VKQTTPAVDIETCTRVQDKMWQEESGKDQRPIGETLAVARGSKITHTVCLETIE